MERVLKFAKTLIESCTEKGDIAIDATVGHGNDTLFLAKIVSESGKVYGFDIQNEALQKAQLLLDENDIKQVSLINDSHHLVKNYLPIEEKGAIASVMFNLGYCPQGNHALTTMAETTLIAVQECLFWIKIHGLIVLVVYPGHPEGKKETDALLTFCETLDQKTAHVLMYRFINQIHDAPFILAIERLK